MLVVIYDDAAYGAEVHHFKDHHPVELVQFPDTDFAALARAAGAQGVTATTLEDLDAIGPWLQHRDGPLVVDAKITPEFCAQWLEEAFR
jgi:thiamine pyrophosphate-dependent acetolactate synthase large subunit-like protein